MFLKKAMRYYRLWIYACNAVLLVSVIVFLGVAVGILCNPYITLVPTPAPYTPSILYGYIALFLQAGILQAIGCLGAIRLCQKLLHTYWILLLSLLAGDIIVGLIWLIRFAHITDGITPYLTLTIRTYYGTDQHITDVWDSVQRSHECCGSEGPLDYYNNMSHTMLPNSCCYSRQPVTKVSVQKADSTLRYVSHDQVTIKEDKVPENFTQRLLKDINATCLDVSYVPHLQGCADHISGWYKDSVETLMILGFCVITFIKLCFAGILRFEIQEMMQKIRVLQGETLGTPNQELAEALGMVPERKLESGLLGNQVNESESVKNTPQLLLRNNHIATQPDGVDSDTNSHSALITDTPVRNSHPPKRKPNGNNNDLTELKELTHVRQTQI